MMPVTTTPRIRLTSLEQHQICASGALCARTLRRILRGEPVRPVVLYRLKSALQQLGMTDRFPELFKAPLGGADDPDPRVVLEDGDVTADGVDEAAAEV